MVKGIIFDFYQTLFDPEENRLFAGVEPLLSRLSGSFGLGLLSTGGERRRRLIGSLGLEKYFKSVLVVPEKRAHHLVRLAEQLGCAPEELLVVGDRLESELSLAKSLGMKTVWLKGAALADERSPARNVTPDFTIFGLQDLAAVLKRLSPR